MFSISDVSRMQKPFWPERVKWIWIILESQLCLFCLSLHEKKYVTSTLQNLSIRRPVEVLAFKMTALNNSFPYFWILRCKVVVLYIATILWFPSCLIKENNFGGIIPREYFSFSVTEKSL